VALSFSLTYPEGLFKLVLVDTTAQMIATDRYPYGITGAEYKIIFDLIAYDFPKYIVDGARAVIPETCKEAKIIRYKIAKQIEQTGRDISFLQATESASFSVVDELHRIKIPTLIIVGKLDLVLRPQNSFFLALHIEDSYLYEFPKAGHAPFLTFKSQFNKVLARFIFKSCDKCDICNYKLEKRPFFPPIVPAVVPGVPPIVPPTTPPTL